MAIDILKALADQEKKPRGSEYLKSFEDEEDKRSADALKAMFDQPIKETIESNREPAAKSQVIPKVSPKVQSATDERIDRLLTKIESAIPPLSTEQKTREELTRTEEGGEQTGTRIVKSQSDIDLLQSEIDALEGKKVKKKQEVESYLDQAVTDLAKRPEGMSLMEVVGKSMLALAPGLIASKYGGYRAGQYAQEGANKFLEKMMESEQSRFELSQKLKAEMAKVRASLSKDDIDSLNQLQKELVKGQVDLRTLPLRTQLELNKLVSAKELTKDQSVDLLKIMADLLKIKQAGGAQAAAPLGAGAGAGGPKPTIAQQTIDKEFGKEYSNFVTEGGFANYGTQINQLNAGIESMKDSDYISGPAVNLMPDVIKPTSRKVQNEILSAASGLMKQVLGGQFAKVEGEGVLKRLFDPQAEENVNIVAAQRFLTQIERAKALKEDQIGYYEKTGTLVGWPGSKKMKELEAEMSGSTGSTQTAIKLTKDLYNKMSSSQRIEYQNATPTRRQEILKSL